jgi:hypothetical protein
MRETGNMQIGRRRKEKGGRRDDLIEENKS